MIVLCSQVLKNRKKNKVGKGRGKNSKKKLSFKIIEPANTSTFLPTSADKGLETAEIRKLVDALGSCWV